MNYKAIFNTAPESIKTACLVVVVFEGNKLSATAKKIDQASGGEFSKILKLGGLGKSPGCCQMIYRLAGVQSERILVVNGGKLKSLNGKDYQKLLATVTEQLNRHRIQDASYCLSDITLKDQSENWLLQQIILANEAGLYRFNQFKSNIDQKKQPTLRKLTVVLNERKNIATKQKQLQQAHAIALGINQAKNLANLPGNICTPAYLAKEAKRLQKRFPKLKVSVLAESEMKKLGMGAFLSVSKGSEEPGKLIVLQYLNGKKGKKPAVLVGKGITFDTGGISLKPGPKMDEMKYDMCGAASVFGVITACAEMSLPVNVIGVVAAAENMPSGRASKPGDIVTSMSGQTIEILNTDAEGRLVLCDALSYVERFKPAAVIDIATLTGACIVALGRVPSALYSNHEPLAKQLIQAGEASYDRVWRMPLWDDYQEQLQSNFADFSNLGGPDGGSITAACFLSRFTQQYHWAHLDIAGTAWISGAGKAATGRPVPLLMQYLIDQHAEKT